MLKEKHDKVSVEIAAWVARPQALAIFLDTLKKNGVEIHYKVRQ